MLCGIYQGSKSSVLRLISDFFTTPRTILEISVNLKRKCLWGGVIGVWRGLGEWLEPLNFSKNQQLQGTSPPGPPPGALPLDPTGWSPDPWTLLCACFVQTVALAAKCANTHILFSFFFFKICILIPVYLFGNFRKIIFRVLIICVFCQVDIGQDLSDKLSNNEELLQYVFSLLSQKKTHMTACQFIEDILQSRKTVLNLNTMRKHFNGYCGVPDPPCLSKIMLICP